MGIVSLSGTNTYLGETLIQSGILNLNGSVLGDLNIESSGTLSGNATVKGSIYNSGTISPGDPINEVFTTDLYLYSTSVYHVEVDSTGCSLINATGTAILGGVLEVTQDPASYSSSGQYTILQTTGGIKGAFDSMVIHGLPGYQFHLENNGYTLSLIYKFIPLPPKNLRGKRIKNQFLTQTDLVNVLRWDPPINGAVPVAYKVYRTNLNRLIGIVGAGRALNFEDHNRSKNITYTYYIVSVDAQDNNSLPASITVTP